MLNFLARTFSGTSRDALKQGDYFGDIARTVSQRSGGRADEIMTSLTDKAARKPDDILAPLYKQIDEDLGHGVLRSNDSIDAMVRNLFDTAEYSGGAMTKSGELFAGLSRAGQTKPQALGFGAFGNPERLLGSVVGGAAFGAGAASISGGDVGEGALMGGAIGLSGAAAAKVFRESLGGIETSAMKGILGGKFDISDRGKNLAAIRDIDFDDAVATKGMSGLDKFLGKRMKDTSKPSIGMQSRTAVASGALLSGLAFTSPAGSNKKRGFNKNRGNRF